MLQMDSATLFVLPSSRSIRERIQSTREINQLLAHHMTIGEFLSRLIFVDNAKMIDMDQRNLLLLEASKFDIFSKLQIERNFFAFVQNSHYIFRFLEELSGERVSIDALQRSDTYGEYEEHLQVLQELLTRYKALMRSHDVVDSITLKDHYRFNDNFIASFERVNIESIGYLTAFELELIEHASKHAHIRISFESTPFNTKMQEKFRALGFDIVSNASHQLDFTSHTTQHIKPFSHTMPDIKCMGFTQRILQVAFVKQQIYEMLKSGIAAENIAVVVPDETFVEVLRSFDAKHNFNFAMGSAFSQTLFYKRLKAYEAFMDDPTCQNRARLQRLGSDDFELFAQCYSEAFDLERFRTLIETVLDKEADSQILTMVREALFHFEKLSLVLAELSMRQALHLFMERLRALHLDDVGGGNVTVLGLLETRGTVFEGVIIVDFNEGFAPRISEKDLFLNTAIREHSGLPTTAQRQDLQKHYYHQLMYHAKQIAISYVHNSEMIPSRFLAQMQIDTVLCNNEAAYADILFKSTSALKSSDDPIGAVLDFRSMVISATMLKSYLTCKRHFYYRYIAKIASHQIPRDLPQEWEIGNKLHEALHRLYTKQSHFENYEALEHALDVVLDAADEHNALVRYQLKLWREKLRPFSKQEWERFQRGVQIVACEKTLTCQIDDLNIMGRIDRIDQSAEGLEVLDYKSGSYAIHSQKQLEEASDFQLEFYDLLASTLGTVTRCSYYDLGSGVLVSEPFAHEKRDLLIAHLKALPREEHVSFDRCEDIKQCSRCDYAMICGRG